MHTDVCHQEDVGSVNGTLRRQLSCITSADGCSIEAHTTNRRELASATHGIRKKDRGGTSIGRRGRWWRQQAAAPATAVEGGGGASGGGTSINRRGGKIAVSPKEDAQGLAEGPGGTQLAWGVLVSATRGGVETTVVRIPAATRGER